MPGRFLEAVARLVQGSLTRVHFFQHLSDGLLEVPLADPAPRSHKIGDHLDDDLLLRELCRDPERVS